MADAYSTGAEGQALLTRWLTERGHDVRPSDKKTFDLIVDGKYVEVKSSNGPYSKLGFTYLTQTQHRALLDGVDFDLFIVCNVAHPAALDVLRIPAALLKAVEPTVEAISYCSRPQLHPILWRQPTASA